MRKSNLIVSTLLVVVSSIAVVSLMMSARALDEKRAALRQECFDRGGIPIMSYSEFELVALCAQPLED